MKIYKPNNDIFVHGIPAVTLSYGRTKDTHCFGKKGDCWEYNEQYFAVTLYSSNYSGIRLLKRVSIPFAGVPPLSEDEEITYLVKKSEKQLVLRAICLPKQVGRQVGLGKKLLGLKKRV